MAHQLVYNEQGCERIFSTICPHSANTIIKQTTPLNPPGLTVVAYIPHHERAPFIEAVQLLKSSGRSFQAFYQFHVTLLGLFSGEHDQALSTQDFNRISATIERFFARESVGPLRIDFDPVRPGLFKDRPGSSDGTVVALVNEQTEDAILSLSAKLSEYLTRQLADLFAEKPQRPLFGAWCSLGFFDEADFEIDEQVFAIFNQLADFHASVRLETLAITEFTYKSLADGVVRTIMKL